MTNNTLHPTSGSSDAPRSGTKRTKHRHRLGGTPATIALARAGIEYTLHAFEHDPRAASYGLEAAAALDLDPARVLKTLMARVDGILTVAIVPVTRQLDLKTLARAVGGSRADMAEIAAAERATGYVAGGISPLGQRTPHPTVVEKCALDFPTVFVSAGRRGLEAQLAPADLVRLTGATTARLGR